MRDRSCGTCLAQEPLPTVLVADELGLQHLQRNRPIELLVMGLVDDAHAATAQLFDDAVMGDGLADHVVASINQEHRDAARQ
jgi:hypothetical protein